MSRIGSVPIEIPEKTTALLEKDVIKVSGPLGNLEQKIEPVIKVKIDGQKIIVQRKNESRQAKALHGLTRSLIANMILGVTKGWEKTLEIHGTGYKAQMAGDSLNLSVGFSHPVVINAIEGIKFAVLDNREIKITGQDKVLVGNVAARIRKIRPPDAYKGKGIRYQGERVKLKPGKAGKAGAAGDAAG
jgi:large subunit ribosomal protein L6